MPLEIRLSGAGAATQDVVINHTGNGQEFIVSVPFVVTGVTFDPNKHIISRNNVATLANEAFDLDQSISIYPNPAHDNVVIRTNQTIATSSVMMHLFDINGKSIERKRLQNTEEQVDVKHLKSGIYFIKANSVNNYIISKIFISH
jgi:hypothetical protein